MDYCKTVVDILSDSNSDSDPEAEDEVISNLNQLRSKGNRICEKENNIGDNAEAAIPKFNYQQFQRHFR